MVSLNTWICNTFPECDYSFSVFFLSTSRNIPATSNDSLTYNGDSWLFWERKLPGFKWIPGGRIVQEGYLLEKIGPSGLGVGGRLDLEMCFWVYKWRIHIHVYTQRGEPTYEWMREKHKAGEQVLSSVKSGDQTDDGNYKKGKGSGRATSTLPKTILTWQQIFTPLA